MNRILSIIICAFISLATYAQQPMIGYFSYDAAIKAMPEYAAVQKTIADLRVQYDNEIKSAQKEFTDKYELFLEQQSRMATAIREKRQSELQLLMERNEAFSAETKELLKKAEADAMQPLYAKLSDLLKELGETNGYFIILNTDNNACPYINSAVATDINALVAEKLQSAGE